VALEKRQDTYFSEDGSTIFQIWFDGYYKGIASQAQLDFRHLDEKLQKYELSLVGERQVVYGSQSLWDCLKKNDARFSRHRLPRQNWTDEAVTLSDAITLAHGIVAAHASDEARQIDPKMCCAVGGHIHIARVTRSGGAQWVVEPRSEHQS
jgi:hypothetical protein